MNHLVSDGFMLLADGLVGVFIVCAIMAAYYWLRHKITGRDLETLFGGGVADSKRSPRAGGEHGAGYVGRLEKEFVLTFRFGARAAALLMTTAQKFQSSITVEYKGQTADARQMMELMLLGYNAAAKNLKRPELEAIQSDLKARKGTATRFDPQQGERIKVIATGPDASDAIKAMGVLFPTPAA